MLGYASNNFRASSALDTTLGNPKSGNGGSSGCIHILTFERSAIGMISFKNLNVIATTLRKVITANSNDWSAIAWSKENGFIKSINFPGLDIYDRVGGGDGFASGFIYGIIEGLDLRDAINLGTAHGALAMTTPGDTSMVSIDEVKNLIKNPSARVSR